MESICKRDGDLLIYPCPQCSLYITTAIHELNCRIFRHGFHVKQNLQIPPHEPKEICEQWASSPDVVGSCKPYEIISRDNMFVVQACDYK